ncbi:hypothetical protein NIES2098_35950 [Calothrix sp. NIES-2098]|nr:hypothetical protein NIES2098_35950 [Calothrix sp. NIES-2098]
MLLTRASSDQKYLKLNCLLIAVWQCITEQHQAIKVNWQNGINCFKYLVKQSSSSAKSYRSKSLSTDVETEAVNGYMDDFIQNLNNYYNFSQIFKCNFRYLNRLSKVKLTQCNYGSSRQSTQDYLQQLTVNKLSNYKRYKIHFRSTEAVLRHFPTDIVEILLTGNRFNKNECYKVAT